MNWVNAHPLITVALGYAPGVLWVCARIFVEIRLMRSKRNEALAALTEDKRDDIIASSNVNMWATFKTFLTSMKPGKK